MESTELQGEAFAGPSKEHRDLQIKTAIEKHPHSESRYGENESQDTVEYDEQKAKEQATVIDKIKRSYKIFQVNTFNADVQKYVSARDQYQKENAGLSGVWNRLKKFFGGKKPESEINMKMADRNLRVSANTYFETWKEFYVKNTSSRLELEKKFSSVLRSLPNADIEDRLKSIFDYQLSQGLAGNLNKGFENMFFTAGEYREKIFDTLHFSGERGRLKNITYKTYKESGFYDGDFDSSVQQILSELEDHFGVAVPMKLQLHDDDVIVVWVNKVANFLAEKNRAGLLS